MKNPTRNQSIKLIAQKIIGYETNREHKCRLRQQLILFGQPPLNPVKTAIRVKQLEERWKALTFNK
jgi:hypothetical protein